MSRHSTFPHRPPSEHLCDLHVYKVPLDLWRAPFNNILNQSVTETVSLGIIRVPPDIPLCEIRGEIEKQLEEVAPKDYVFLRSVGRSITRVKSRQEYEWTAKHFLPPKHYAPELYILEATPELRDALAISDRSSQLSPVSMHHGSPGARSYRNGYGGYPTHRQGYPDESRSYQRHGPDKTTPLHRYSPLPKIKPHNPSQSREYSPDPGAYLTDLDTQMAHSDRNPDRYDKLRHQDRGEEGYPGEGPYGARSYKSKQAPQTSPRETEADRLRSQRHPPIGVFYDGRDTTDPTPPPVDHGGSPRSPSPGRKGAGSKKSYRGANGGYEREAAYTNNTNEDSGVAGMSPDNQYKQRDRENYYRAANSKSRDHGRYKREEEEEEKRRLQELEERALTDRNRWANEQDERRWKEEEDRQREEARRRTEEEEKERRRREEDEERRRLEEEEDRRREEEKRRLEEEEEERRRNEDEDRRHEQERRRFEEEEDEKRRKEEEDRRREEDEERRRREEDEERRRREEEDRLKNGSEEEQDRYYDDPSSPPPLRLSSPDLDGQRDTESAQRRRSEEQKKLLEELQEAREGRHSTEREREELVKKAKTLQSKTQNRRNLARDIWKKRYFEEKKKTPPLEDQTNRLRDELDALHRKLMNVLEGPKEKNVKGGDSRPSQKNNYIIQCTRLQHDIDDLKRRVENAKMKLTAEMKLRHQAVGEARLLRGELTKEKIKLSQTRNQHFAALSPWMMGSTPIPNIPQGKGETESAAA